MKTRSAITTEQMMAVKDVPHGEFVKLKPESNKVYTRQNYNRGDKRYDLDDCDDIGRSIAVKGDRKVFVGFTY